MWGGRSLYVVHDASCKGGARCCIERDALHQESADQNAEHERRQQEHAERLRVQREAKARHKAIEAKAEEIRKEKDLAEIRKSYTEAEELVDKELASRNHGSAP